LLTTGDPHEALCLAHQLDALNVERRAIEKQVEQEAFLQASLQSDDPCLMVSGQGWHEGILGIVASRLKDKFFKPCFVIGWSDTHLDLGKSSARSVPGCDIGALIHGALNQGHLLKGGGHPMAGGLSLTKSAFEAFRLFAHQYICTHTPNPPLPSLTLEMPVPFQALTAGFLEDLQALAPFGQHNSTPVWMFQDVRLQHVALVGDTHLRLDLMQQDHVKVTAMAFRAKGTPLGDFLLQRPSGVFSVAATAHADTFRGGVSLYVEDVMPGPLSKPC
jgi:single-stranded-DNA-specific exonuclease